MNHVLLSRIWVSYLGGPILTRAAWYTAGMVGGLSTVAACAPSDKFLSMGAPLAMGLGVVFCASIGTMFLPPTTALGSGTPAIRVYLFESFLTTLQLKNRLFIYLLYLFPSYTFLK